MELKLTVDTHGQRVIFAEAGNDFVDFLFHVSYLPLGTVMNLLSMGSLGNIYKSIEDHGDRIMHPGRKKNDIRMPKIVSISKFDPQLFPKFYTSTSRNFKICSCNGRDHLRIGRRESLCSLCTYGPVEFVDAYMGADEGGYVKDNEMFMVMDDLLVRPISAYCSITLLKSYGVKDIASVETREVVFGNDEALKLLKASIDSKTVLTDTFLRSQDSKASTIKG